MIPFIKKEFMEQVRTYRLLIMLSVLSIFGMISPLFAKIAPDIISSMDMQGATIILPEPTAIDAYIQFHKNVSQMGLVVILLVFGSVLSNELSKGTLINVLSKGLSRNHILLAKFISAFSLWTVSFLLAAGLNQIYMMYLFDASILQNMIIALVCLWIYGAYIISLIILSSTIASGNYGGLIVTILGLGALLIANMFPALERFNPMTLSSYNLEIVSATADTAKVAMVLIMTILYIVINLLGSMALFRKRKI